MKKNLIITLLVGGFIISSANAKELVDKVIARVNGVNILHSYLQEPRIEKNGNRLTLEEAIEHEVLFQTAAERKLLPTTLDIEKNLAKTKSGYGYAQMSDEEFEKHLKKDGLTIKKYRTQLARLIAVQQLKQVEISERVIVTSREVEEFHKNNPQESDDRYKLLTVVIQFIDIKKDEDLSKLKNRKKLKWMDLDWVDKSEIADEMGFVHTMKEGDISEPIKTDDGYQLVKLVEKEMGHSMTIDERWVNIENMLQKKKMDDFEKTFITELKDKASIVYLD